MFMTHLDNQDASTPSFFEMIAEDQMMPTFRPAIRYIFTVLAQRNFRWEPFVRYNDEIFSLIRLFLEHHYLKYYDASFSENFYGLKRAKVVRGAHGRTTAITDTDRFLSLMCMVVAPYLKSKVDNYYRHTVGPLYSWTDLSSASLVSSFPEEAASSASAATQSLHISPPTLSTRIRSLFSHARIKGFLRQLFVTGYPLFNAVYEGLFFLYQLLYLYDLTRFYTPFLHLLRIQVKRLSMEDSIMQSQATLAQRAREMKALQGLSPWRLVARLALRGWHFLLDYTPYILPVALFLFKFFEWYYAENRGAAPSLPTPPPPEPPKKVEGGIELPTDRKECGLCRKLRTNPAMLNTGFVFCYPCIFNYIHAHGRCPVTLMPCSVDHIRKIYEPN